MSTAPISYTCRSTFDTAGLADAFAEIEKHDERVSSVTMHPDSLHSFYDKEAREIFDIDGDDYRVWGPAVIFDEDVAADHVLVVGGDDKPIKCRLEKISDEELAQRRQEAHDRSPLNGDEAALPTTTDVLLDIMEDRGEVDLLIETLRERGYLDRLVPIVTADSE
jgi:hypothetical protein